MTKFKANICGFLMLVALTGVAVGLATWKKASTRKANAATTNQPEPMETVMATVAKPFEYRPTTTSIGTIIALRSITLQNELPGTVSRVELIPGKIVEKGEVLIRLDVSVEQAELEAQEARAALAQTILTRMQAAQRNRAVSEIEVDRASAELNIAKAEVVRTKAIIARKTIRAPFRARVGLADLHVGQYLNEGTQLTTLQGVDEAVHVDFAVAQRVAQALKVGQTVDVFISDNAVPTTARIVALDSRIDPTTRNAKVRARITHTTNTPAPGASVRIRIPVGPPHKAVMIPVNALRRGPDGEYVFVIQPDKTGALRAHLRPVQSEAMFGDEVAICDGLSAGEQIAATGSFKLREQAIVGVANGTCNQK